MSQEIINLVYIIHNMNNDKKGIFPMGWFTALEKFRENKILSILNNE